MNLGQLMTLGALTLGGIALGCSDKCKSNCEDQQNCADATPAEKAVDCGKRCDDAQQSVDKANCDDQFRSFNDCEAGLSNICTASGSACAPQINALAVCLSPYCAKNPSDGTCMLYLGTSG
jgi:hypothetical protein